MNGFLTTQFNNSTDSGLTQTYDFADMTSLAWTLLDPLVDWLPYKIEKYIPTWHLVRSYK